MKEFTKRSKLSRQTVYDWMKRGFIERKNFGKKPMFTEEDLINVPSIQNMLKQNQHRL